MKLKCVAIYFNYRQQDSNSLKDHLLATTHRSIRIANQQELQQRHQRKQQKLAARRNSSSSGIGAGNESGCEEHPNSKTNNSPSPRTKHSRKQAKGKSHSLFVSFSHSLPRWIRFRFSNFTHAPINISTCDFHWRHTGRTKSIPSTTSETGATTSSSHQSNLSSASFLLPKMQAEQGSIGELQKYHSRYLKNRRHTLANVR